MSEVRRNLDALLGAAVPMDGLDQQAANAGTSEVFYGHIIDGGLLIDGSTDGAPLPGPFESLVPYAEGSRVAFVLRGRRPLIIQVQGGFGASDQWAGMESQAEQNAEDIAETSALVVAHEGRLEATEQLVSDTKDALDATDGVVDGLAVEVTRQGVEVGEALQAANLATELAEGLVSFEEEPPADPPVGQIWMPLNEDGQVTGMWRWTGDEWATYTLLTGLLIVPTEDGGQTIIGPDGVEATQVVADILRTDVLYADVAGVKTLVITDIPRQNLAEDVGDALATAETLGSRILIDGAAGTLTIARNRPQPSDPLTAMILGATSLDMVVADKSVAYIDSELEQMSIPNVLVRDSLQVGAHQVRTLPESGITIFQQVAEVS